MPSQARAKSRKILIVGAGFYGSVCARELTSAGYQCLVIDKRNHIGGNCYSVHEPDAGCHRHVYGPHIFHTDLERVWEYVNRFARFNHFVNRLKVRHKGKLYSFPLNLFTLYQMFGVSTPAEAEACLAGKRLHCENPPNLEEWCLSQVGPELYETFIKGYTVKQWKKDPRQLPASIIQRLPVRLTFDDNYYTHPHQGIPVGGYTAMFERMLEGIEIRLNTDFLADPDGLAAGFDMVIYTGPIDAFFGYSEGVLEYRSLRFEIDRLPIKDFQGNAIVNYTEEEVPWTRIIEHKHFEMNVASPSTVITREFPADWSPGSEPYYAVDTPNSRATLARYQAKAGKLEGKVVFGGRLAEFKYYDMDQVIAAALAKSCELLKGF
jgi:UDP-galactopyranose mutase